MAPWVQVWVLCNSLSDVRCEEHKKIEGVQVPLTKCELSGCHFNDASKGVQSLIVSPFTKVEFQESGPSACIWNCSEMTICKKLGEQMSQNCEEQILTSCWMTNKLCFQSIRTELLLQQ